MSWFDPKTVFVYSVKLAHRASGRVSWHEIEIPDRGQGAGVARLQACRKALEEKGLFLPEWTVESGEFVEARQEAAAS